MTWPARPGPACRTCPRPGTGWPSRRSAAPCTPSTAHPSPGTTHPPPPYKPSPFTTREISPSVVALSGQGAGPDPGMPGAPARPSAGGGAHVGAQVGGVQDAERLLDPVLQTATAVTTHN